MGKKRITIIDDSEAKKKPTEKKRKLVRTGKEHGRITDMGAEALAEAERLKEKEKQLTKETKTKSKKAVKKKVTSKTKVRGKKYQEARKKVDRKRLYSLPEAIKLAQETSISKFNGSIEVHLVVKETGLKGGIKFPYPTGKQTKIAIANEALLKKIEQGKLDFDLLLATPAMMPKLTKYAKILGPKGLMPNPKAGTITDKPEETAKKMAGKTQFKTEVKAPLIHLVIGQVNNKPQELEANFKVLIETVGISKINKAIITSTMGPGIKVDLTSI
ncbi:MAG TPA: hypothetical protein VMY36_04680 [Patescibacteria group bacterium]|nr:hypothetical protein [Patescibacteria group bacterium]